MAMYVANPPPAQKHTGHIIMELFRLEYLPIKSSPEQWWTFLSRQQGYVRYPYD